jgi:hypothetical protein
VAESKTFMGDISKGLANTFEPEKNLFVARKTAKIVAASFFTADIIS